MRNNLGIGTRATVKVVRTDNIDLNNQGTVLTAAKLKEGDRMLLIGQTAKTQNGIYSVTSSNTLVRAVDMPIGSRTAGTQVHVQNGLTYMCINNPNADVVNTNELVWESPVSGSCTRLVRVSDEDLNATTQRPAHDSAIGPGVRCSQLVRA